MADIAFLHTSPVHVATFEALLREACPGLTARHVVREDLLAEAQRVGLHDPALQAGLRQALDAAAAQAAVVVCTCSTLGALAESNATGRGVPVMRVDRAMADTAVRRGAPVLMVAAVKSTLQPTEALLRSSAERLGLPLVSRALWVEAAWPLFEAGRHGDYLATLVDAVLAEVRAGETVLLAQASMAGAEPLLARHGLTVLSSPRLGVEHAVQLSRTPR